MKKLFFSVSALMLLFSATSLATDKKSELKPLAIQIASEAQAIAQKARTLYEVEEEYQGKAQRDLHIQVQALKETAAPLGEPLDRPYGRCMSLVDSLHGFINAQAGAESNPSFWYGLYNSASTNCDSQIADTYFSKSTNIRPLEF